MGTLYLDIETIPPAMGLSALVLDKAPGNLSKPDTIEKWRRENAGSGWRRLSVDPWRAEVACVAWALDDGPVRVSADLEAVAVALLDAQPARVVAHNGRAFDIPILWRALARLPSTRRAARLVASWTAGKPWEQSVVDTCADLAIRSPYGVSAPSLATLCEALGVATPKGDLDGAGVLDAWLSGDEGRARVMAYCAGDVVALREVHRRLVELGRLAP